MRWPSRLAWIAGFVGTVLCDLLSGGEPVDPRGGDADAGVAGGDGFERTGGSGVRGSGGRGGPRVPDAGRSEGFAPVRGDFQQYRYLVPSTCTLYAITGARSRASRLVVRAESRVQGTGTGYEVPVGTLSPGTRARASRAAHQVSRTRTPDPRTSGPPNYFSSAVGPYICGTDWSVRRR